MKPGARKPSLRALRVRFCRSLCGQWSRSIASKLRGGPPSARNALASASVDDSCRDRGNDGRSFRGAELLEEIKHQGPPVCYCGETMLPAWSCVNAFRQRPSISLGPDFGRARLEYFTSAKVMLRRPSIGQCHSRISRPSSITCGNSGPLILPHQRQARALSRMVFLGVLMARSRTRTGPGCGACPRSTCPTWLPSGPSSGS